ncbi:MAG TPA: adenosine deaminase [Kofleriaceae bacterium]|nr:adenosine deaminase [Kofleriaceae bacterium]
MSQSPELSLALIEKLPKTDLHCHLDGSLRLDTVIDLARKQNVELPTFDRDGLHALLYAGERCHSLDDYLRTFDITLSVMQTEEALERAAFELAEDAWRENVRYLEVRYSPLLHLREGLRPAAAVESVLRGLRAAKRSFGLRYGVILCAIRSQPADQSLRIAELCVAFKNRGVVGFDLAGSEVNNPAKLHRQAFQLVIDNNINCTAHAGESFGPDSVHQAIHKCGAHRIGHGVRAVESGDLLNYINDHRIPLEVCPSSNVQTKAAASWESHPVDFYVDYGLRVTINTDNRLITGTTVSRELHLCHQHYGWPLATIKEIIISGFKSAFMPYREKADLLAEVSAELATFQVAAPPAERAAVPVAPVTTAASVSTKLKSAPPASRGSAT